MRAVQTESRSSLYFLPVNRINVLDILQCMNRDANYDDLDFLACAQVYNEAAVPWADI